MNRELHGELSGGMVIKGYGGRILRIDLTGKDFKVEPTDLEWMKSVVGGRAANSKRLLEELDFECDPLGPENMLIFGIGPLTGTLLPASAYYTVTARSPLTGILGDSAAGGHFAAEMKLTGFDQIIITGALQSLSYLVITTDGVEFVECPYLKDVSIIEATCAIRKTHTDTAIQVAAIGPAGEHGVLYSTIVSSGNRVNGRTGMGAVMGSKNVKAIAVKGWQPVNVADPPLLLSQVRALEKAIVSHPEYGKRHHMGTTMLMQDLNSIGILPTHHFQEGVCPYVERISGEALAEKYKVKNKSCFNCNVHCSRYYICDQNEAEGPEFETLCSFTSRIGNDDLAFALKMNAVLNQMGLDSISTGEILGWIMECQEKGILTPQDLGGLSLSWGDTDAIGELMEKIAFRQGIGDMLAEGAWRVSQRFSEKARELVMQVKGLDIICGDPRGIKAYGLSYAISSRGADHLRAEPYFELTNRKKEALARFGTEKAADRLSEEGKAPLVIYSEKIALLCDSITMCKNIGLCMDVLNFKQAAVLLTAATGIPYTPGQLETFMEQSIERDHIINNRFGMTRAEDTLPRRFLTESLTSGPTSGSVVNIDKMVDEYYTLHHWE
ncbi:MAG: aldehyde ferredoxin oxidoreductase family protein [Theionarchaea archaeon]|nr:aldehyde ferredoxin oxidoreductase family protein [Theionarchaea archaeon]